jgi:3-oxoacyl-[acyl-carrier protein] reductase
LRIVIVGGSSSVGGAVARGFAGRGDRVIATYARSVPEPIEGVDALPLDLTKPDSFPAFAEKTGPIDHLVLLAGILPGKSLPNYTQAMLDEVMGVNFTAQAALVRDLMPVMAPGGSVIAMSSISAQQGSFDPIYAASKAALVAFVKSMAAWHGATTRFNCVAPSLIQDSTMFQDMAPERRQYHVDQTPTGELLRIGDLADIIIDLTEPRWRSLNGAVIALNGGRAL